MVLISCSNEFLLQFSFWMIRYRKEISMGFFKNLFSKEEPFVPTPTQDVPGLDPLVVQAIENLFPDTEIQKQALDFSLKFLDTKKGNTVSLLAMLKMGVLDIDNPLLDNGRFW